MNPEISIIMSVKNGAKSLDKCISSIINQTFSNWEFIICDDGSTDSTLELLQNYFRSDKRFIILHNDESRGLAYSLNKCISQARSNILARQDADDTSHSKRFEHQLKFVKEHPEYAIVGTNWYNSMSEGRLVEQKVKEVPTALDQYKRGMFMHPSWMMRKDQLEKVDFYTANQFTRRSQDYHLVMKILSVGMKLYNLQETLYYYTVDDSTIQRSMNWKNVKGLMWIRWDAYRRNRLPLYCYLYVIKPMISNLIPRGLMLKYYRKAYSK